MAGGTAAAKVLGGGGAGVGPGLGAVPPNWRYAYGMGLGQQPMGPAANRLVVSPEQEAVLPVQQVVQGQEVPGRVVPEEASPEVPKEECPAELRASSLCPECLQT